MPKKCICDEMACKTLFFEARSFKCPEHGQVTIDKRSAFVVPLQVPITVQPLYQPRPTWPYTPVYIGNPPQNPLNYSGTTWSQAGQAIGGNPGISTNVYNATGKEQTTFTIGSKQ